jgi:hypothetical protein
MFRHRSPLAVVAYTNYYWQPLAARERGMRYKMWVAGIVAIVAAMMPLRAEDRPWSVSVYYGPATTKYFCAFLQTFDMHPTSTMLGVALDRRLLPLGYDISIAAEAQATAYFFGHTNTTYGLGLGLQFDRLFGYDRAHFSIFMGPSYATDPPYTSIGYKHRTYKAARDTFLNFVSFELAVGLPKTKNWDMVFRMYHRSGMFGVYSNSDDDGLMFGLGARYRF